MIKLEELGGTSEFNEFIEIISVKKEEIKLYEKVDLRIGLSIAQVEKMVTYMQGNLRTVIELNHFKELMEQN